MNVTVKRVSGDTFECVNGHARLAVGLDVLGKVPVTDIETGETFEVHRVDGEILRLKSFDEARAETSAAHVVRRASDV
ncbi:hypothetical protein HMI51_41100 [Corallococcus coralloides]|nr:hypothetical protein [Corallococcus coralloides]